MHNTRIIKKKNRQVLAAMEIGKGLHTIQEFFAHNVNLNGNVVSSRKVADDKLNIEGIRYIGGIHPQYFEQSFFEDIKVKEHKLIYAGIKMHSLTADNPNAYFNGRKWEDVTKEQNPKYIRALGESIDYLRKFKKIINGRKVNLSVGYAFLLA